MAHFVERHLVNLIFSCDNREKKLPDLYKESHNTIKTSITKHPGYENKLAEYGVTIPAEDGIITFWDADVLGKVRNSDRYKGLVEQWWSLIFDEENRRGRTRERCEYRSLGDPLGDYGIILMNEKYLLDKYKYSLLKTFHGENIYEDSDEFWRFLDMKTRKAVYGEDNDVTYVVVERIEYEKS